MRAMLIVYDSRTGNVRRFVQKLHMPSVQIRDDLILDEPFVLVTYTTGFGQVPDRVAKFLRQNHKWVRAVSASGNRNWGPNFARSADFISRLYGVPILHKFELSGTDRDVEIFKEGVNLVASY